MCVVVVSLNVGFGNFLNDGHDVCLVTYGPSAKVSVLRVNVLLNVQ